MLRLDGRLKTVQFENSNGRLVGIAYAIFERSSCVFTAAYSIFKPDAPLSVRF